MSLSVIDKYVLKKEKDLLDYAKILEQMIEIEDNKMWQKKSDFVTYSKSIIKIYADRFYFENNVHRDNPIDYSNDNINHVLKAIIDYFKSSGKSDKLKTWKNEIFLLSVILCTACYVDFATNVVDGNFSDTKKKFKYLLKYLSNTEILNVKNNKYWINDLFEKAKKNTSEDKKAFLSVESEDHKNIYHKISEKPLYYSVGFSYNIPELEEYDETLKESILKEYEVKLLQMSCDLLVFRVLIDLISNNEMGCYLIPINKNLKKSNIFKILNDEKLKPYVKILVPWEEEVNYQGIIKYYRDNKFEIIYEYNNTENVNSKIFDGDSEFIVNEEFMKNNLDNKMEFERKNITFVIRNKEE